MEIKINDLNETIQNTHYKDIEFYGIYVPKIMITSMQSNRIQFNHNDDDDSDVNNVNVTVATDADANDKDNLDIFGDHNVFHMLISYGNDDYRYQDNSDKKDTFHENNSDTNDIHKDNINDWYVNDDGYQKEKGNKINNRNNIPFQIIQCQKNCGKDNRKDDNISLNINYGPDGKNKNIRYNVQNEKNQYQSIETIFNNKQSIFHNIQTIFRNKKYTVCTLNI